MEWVETTAKSVDEAQRRALDLLGIAAEDAEVEVVDAGSVGWFGRVKTEARVRARVRPRAQVTEERSRRRDTRRSGGKGRNQSNKGGGNAKQSDGQRSGGGNRGNSGNNRSGGRNDNRGGGDGGRQGGRDGGNNRGGNRDGGSRDGGSRDGGSRDGGNRSRNKQGGSRDSGGRDGGNRGDGRNDRSDSGSNRGAAAAAAGGGAAVAAGAAAASSSRGSGSQDAAGDSGGSQRQEGSSGGGRRDQDRSRNRSKSSQASEANVEDEYPVEEQKSVVVDFVAGLAEIFDGDAGIDSTDDGETITVDVSGDDLGLLIGPGAHTLSAIEELTRTTMQRAAGGRRYRRVRVDVDGYRARRNEALVAFAGKVADDVRSSGDRKKLEPMNSADRKIVHDAVGDLDGVSTVSEGNDPRRYVVIVPD